MSGPPWASRVTRDECRKATVTPRREFAVSERLKADFDNGVHYYAMRGREVALPCAGFAAPSLDALRWHREKRYLG